ncbi:MAG: membrane-bound PQQ-dependent dehydrogenase, glucose/quinate/shikimate family [Tropicimonas sp.]|uniref:membrane-bound PQQ-dependent dehydrogenase, glucose/quinate/shikimate family n=1 Tax=Tropicimonas sp. TaxID=2067044 RepID=UPI003A8B69E4
MNSSQPSVHFLIRLFAIVIGLVGLGMLGGGVYLIMLGGSWYYALAGAALTFSAGRCFSGDLTGIRVYLTVFVVTVIWALWEVGLTFWPLVPRIVAPLFLASAALFLVPLFPARRGGKAEARPFLLGGGILALGFIAFCAGMFIPHDVLRNDFTVVPGKISAPTAEMAGNWLSYGRTGEGTRYAPLDQITRENVGQLEKVWEVRTGDIADESLGKEDQNTPIFAAGRLFHCSPGSRVTAIDPATGKMAWQFDPKAQAPYWQRCRSLGFVPAGGEDDECGDRIVVATVDRRMIALRADDGQPCQSFGDGGTVDLGTGVGEIKSGFLMPTTGPHVAGDKIVIGAWIADNDSVGEPSGVIRAYDAWSGDLAWAWDLGNPAITGLPPEGETYTRGTPNVWAPMAFDLELGLIYLPTGNATPDYFGGTRRPFDDEYNSSVVALNLSDGREAWHFRTVNHDIWDYDLPAQPALHDMPDGNGGTIPALIQMTKRGHIFVLDRRTGEPVTAVADLPAPAPDGTVEGEYYAETQPHSVGMPVISADPLSEARMWGATPLDQMVCRIMFRQHRYEGEFTTQSTRPTLQWPGNGGGFNWGSAAIDHERNIMIVNDMRMPISAQLIARDDIPSGTEFTIHGGMSEQRGTPYAFRQGYFLSPLGFPCLSPSMGMITGIDLASRKVVWQIPGGTMGDALGIPLYVGMPTLGGPLSTKGGLVFYGGTQDYYLRAMNVETGEVLWKGRLPVGAQATPMSFLDEASGRQYVVVTAGGARENVRDRGDYIVAFALPQ